MLPYNYRYSLPPQRRIKKNQCTGKAITGRAQACTSTLFGLLTGLKLIAQTPWGPRASWRPILNNRSPKLILITHRRMPMNLHIQSPGRSGPRAGRWRSGPAKRLRIRGQLYAEWT